MKRQFPYVTVGQIIDELNAELREEGLISEGQDAISRATFYRLEGRIEGFPEGKRTSGKRPWRTYTIEEKDQIKELIKNEYWPR